MDKITFLTELEMELDELPIEEKDKLMNDYENHFYNQETKGKSEKEILSDLKEPHAIGKELKAKEAISYAKVTPNLRNIIRAIMASLSLGVISFIFIIIPLLIFLGILLLVFLFSIFLILFPIILIITSFVKGIQDSFSNFLFSVSYSGIGIVLIAITIIITRNLYRLVLKYLSWYIQTIKGRIKQ
ncbi:DUF1700 domain-containing protein [Staphylococcus sp. NRL 16/872]|uniref:HAAS signaling domain-containing protein n=1 Tax=Staphylococcus sp. NRL 16/872 TaxID=2930131 RepID=UPI001FB5187A|nr:MULTISPECIES: DUF1700 domain-containing protein [unclassified Staphylococcus]MCJ1655986.1 DUF1700 domain-containing protein [Staphylococcus sp. NRL 21/187]MCJ1661779.1 DUF1700 domain-containing protein [Staphylococcus sp. NRL 18/288]MCJ1667722.1 DUF1700 domain-containing protein [Staphylococcus sp. NRL 19/737]WEN70212.1 DUF1700 domain-containing protein [Staphylococcus sp. NRL 16/872]